MNLFQKLFGKKEVIETVEPDVISPFIHGILASIKEEPESWVEKRVDLLGESGFYYYWCHEKTGMTLNSRGGVRPEAHYYATSNQRLTRFESKLIQDQLYKFILQPIEQAKRGKYDAERALAIAQETEYFEKLANRNAFVEHVQSKNEK